jgi:hypothetical protein
MPTFNVVRFRVKPGQDQAFLDAHRGGKANWPGLASTLQSSMAWRSGMWTRQFTTEPPGTVVGRPLNWGQSG